MRFTLIDFKKLLFLLFFITVSINFAQISFAVSTDQEYNDNPFHSPSGEKSIISSANLGGQFESELISLGYFGSYINFDAVPDRNFYWHQFGFWKEFDYSTFGFYAEQRINRQEYSYLNYTNFYGYFNYRFNIDNYYFAISPNLSLTKYKELDILDNFKASLSYFINHGFETGTTLIFGGGFNYKKYLDPTQTGIYSYIDESGSIVSFDYIDKNVSSLNQIITYGRIAQSISESTGLAVQFTNRSIINGIANEFKELNMVYGDESEIFDDPVNYESNSLAIELTKIFWDDMTVKGGYYINRKFYPSQGLYDYEGYYYTDIMRTDNQYILNLSVQKKFQPEFLSGTSLNFGINYRYITNSSNSYWFNYKSNSVNISLGFEF